jgi:hypothetical protein
MASLYVAGCPHRGLVRRGIGTSIIPDSGVSKLVYFHPVVTFTHLHILLR